MIGEKAAHVGKELAEQIRLGHEGVPCDADDVWMTLDRLVNSKASTAKDVLALVVMARHLGNCFPAPEGTAAAMAQQYVQHLQAKAIAALEPLASERAAVYQGYETN